MLALAPRGHQRAPSWFHGTSPSPELLGIANRSGAPYVCGATFRLVSAGG